MLSDHQETAKNVMDAVSVVTVIGTLAQVLPAIAAVFTIVWTLIRIYETKTFQSIIRRMK